MKKVIFVLAILLFVLHQDFWFWDDASLVFGFMPIGLFYHAMYSVMAGVLWFLVVKFAWPEDVEEFENELNSGDNLQQQES